MAQYSFYTLRTRGLVLLGTTLVLTIPSLVLLLHSCTVTKVSPAPSFCPTPVVSSTKKSDTTHLDKPLDLAEENLMWADKLPLGGSFSPTGCLPTTRVAILLPFRDREAHLATFLRKMHPFLQAQGIQYTLVVLNQTDSAPFMRGLLFNAGSSSTLFFILIRWSSPLFGDQTFYQGVREVLRHLTPSPDCFVLHDIDHIPERQGLIYRFASSRVPAKQLI